MNKKVIKESAFRQIVKDIIQEAKEQGIYLGTKKNPMPAGEKPKDVKMNAYDSEGTSGKATALVSVDASSSASNSASGKGMKKASFETKTGMNDKKNENGGKDKGELSFDVDMEENDKKIDDNVPKTFVEAGAGSDKEQKTPKVSEKAKNEKDKEPIAKGIVLPEGFEKRIFTKKQLQEFIISEANALIKKKIISESFETKDGHKVGERASNSIKNLKQDSLNESASLKNKTKEVVANQGYDPIFKSIKSTYNDLKKAEYSGSEVKQELKDSFSIDEKIENFINNLNFNF